MPGSTPPLHSSHDSPPGSPKPEAIHGNKHYSNVCLGFRAAWGPLSGPPKVGVGPREKFCCPPLMASAATTTMTPSTVGRARLAGQDALHRASISIGGARLILLLLPLADGVQARAPLWRRSARSTHSPTWPGASSVCLGNYLGKREEAG